MERRHYFPPDIWESLKYYAEDEKLKIQDPEVRNLITPQGLGFAIIENHLVKMGHYPPKTKVADVSEVPEHV